MRLRNPFRRRPTPAQLAFDAQVALLRDLMRELGPVETRRRMRRFADYSVTSAQAIAGIRAMNSATQPPAPQGDADA